MERNQLSQMAVLAAVVTHGSFRGAARALAIAPSAVSHAVSTLEESLGVALLARTTRSVAPTDAGRILLDRLLPALEDIDTALDAVVETRERPAGTLRVSVPDIAAHLLLAPHFGAFCDAYPDITLELCAENRLVDIVAEGFHAGIRLNESIERDMIAARIGPPLRSAVVGAPAYLEQHGIPVHPNDLKQHRCIRFRFPSGIIYRWEFEKDREAMEIDVEGPLVLDDDSLMIKAALQGAGLAFVFDAQVVNALAEGRLVRVMEDWCPPFPGLYLYYPSRRRMLPALRAFIDFYKSRNNPQADSFSDSS